MAYLEGLGEFAGWLMTGFKHSVNLLPTIVSRLDDMNFSEMLDTLDIKGVIRELGFDASEEILDLFIDPETGDLDVIGILMSMKKLFDTGLIEKAFSLSKESPLRGLTKLKKEDIVSWTDMQWGTLISFMVDMFTKLLGISIDILPVIVSLITEISEAIIALSFAFLAESQICLASSRSSSYMTVFNVR